MKALFCYSGRMDDSSTSLPGHPLYSLFLLKSLCKKFEIPPVSTDVFYYDNSEFGTSINYDIKRETRSEIYHTIVDRDNIEFERAMDGNYDIVFLKYRFRNYSRLRERSLDRYYFDQLYKRYGKKCYIIDTDDMITESYENIITLFADDYPYKSKNVIKFIPVLEEDVIDNIKLIKTNTLTFIGNEYSKVGLNETLKSVKSLTNIDIMVQGKWNKHPFITEVIRRESKIYGYLTLSNSLCSIHLSKPNYSKYNFMSPRIFESYLLGTIIFGNCQILPTFSTYYDPLELSEKIKFLQEISIEEYNKILQLEVKEFYVNLTHRLHSFKI